MTTRLKKNNLNTSFHVFFHKRAKKKKCLNFLFLFFKLWSLKTNSVDVTKESQKKKNQYNYWWYLNSIKVKKKKVTFFKVLFVFHRSSSDGRISFLHGRAFFFFSELKKKKLEKYFQRVYQNKSSDIFFSLPGSNLPCLGSSDSFSCSISQI